MLPPFLNRIRLKAYDDFLEQDYCEKSFTVEVEYHESRKPGDYTGTMQYNFALTYVG